MINAIQTSAQQAGISQQSRGSPGEMEAKVATTVQSAIGVVESAGGTWGPVLETITVFAKIVEKLGAVRRFLSMRALEIPNKLPDPSLLGRISLRAPRYRECMHNSLVISTCFFHITHSYSRSLINTNEKAPSPAFSIRWLTSLNTWKVSLPWVTWAIIAWSCSSKCR